ncbi:MAG: MotA/TolQ/ExbB proton channel family protein [Defluviitaleaceae bacterium]|nr:MotA/TolQ/ExbB proton channel family protein [Defluviitaleaceae bacterium]
MFSFFTDTMASQTAAGQVISYIIFGIFIVFIIMSVFVLTYFKDIGRKARRLRAGKDGGNAGAYISDVRHAYEGVIHKGMRDVGDTDILDDNINPTIKLFEYFIHYLPSLATVTGLLGTFVGLTAAIGRMDLNIEQLYGIEQVIDSINAPMGDMSTAFVTSLVGIVASAMMNIFERMFRVFARSDEAIAEVRDYININFQNDVLTNMTPAERFTAYENDPASIAWSDASRRIAKVLTSLKESVDKMSGEISSLETRGITNLSNNIAELTSAYASEHADVASINESMRMYIDRLRDLGIALNDNGKMNARNEEILEQIAVTYRLLAEEQSEKGR